MATLYTVGHSTRSAEKLIELLREHGVELLVDVRRYPTSRRHPQFRAEALEGSLREAGIAYRHEEALGGYRSPHPESPNRGWESDGFRGYADHLLTEEGRDAVDRLLGAAGERTVAVMCAEAVPWRCHRQVLADALVARGADVRHILGPGKSEEHALREMARVTDGGDVVYPADEPGQPELFAEGDG